MFFAPEKQGTLEYQLVPEVESEDASVGEEGPCGRRQNCPLSFPRRLERDASAVGGFAPQRGADIQQAGFPKSFAEDRLGGIHQPGAEGDGRRVCRVTRAWGVSEVTRLVVVKPVTGLPSQT